jgi:hypothetical protein
MTATTAAPAANSDVPQENWVETLARFGYAAKGFVYLVVGGLALQVATGNGGQTGGPKEALSEIATQPFGRILLALTGVGLIGYSIWRLVQAWSDPERKGTDAKGILTRIGYVCSGLIYGGLAFEAARMAIGGGSSGGSSTEHWTARLMAQPFGQFLVGGVGAVIVGVGLYQFYRAWKASFEKTLKWHEMNDTERKWSTRVGQAGIAARGIVYLLTGTFLLVAAIRSNPQDSMGTGEALQYLGQQSYGPWLLGAVAAGLAAYGVFSALILSRYRRIIVDTD